MAGYVKSFIVSGMKILWLSSVQLTDEKKLISGTWIPGLLSLLKTHYPDLVIVNITKGRVSHPIKVENEFLCEWLLPETNRMSIKIIRQINDIVDQEVPDIIQVWGTEDIWGLFPFHELYSHIPTILEIQGILASVSEEYYGGLTPMELLKCWNIKEFLKPSSSLPAIRRLYSRNVGRETQILRNFSNIGVQSVWSASVVRTINPIAKLYKSGIALRPAFYKSKKWQYSNNSSIRVFSTALMGQPLKGAYTLFKAFAIVRQRFPKAQLILAGANEFGIRRSGFCRMLTKFAKEHEFWDSVHQLGPLSAEQLAEQYRSASVFVNPSNWESYSVVTAEAMYIGCPTVASYAGAMPELGVNGSVLYFPKGDFRICASHIIKIIENRDLALDLSYKSISVGQDRQDCIGIAKKQMNTYLQLIGQMDKA